MTEEQEEIDVTMLIRVRVTTFSSRKYIEEDLEKLTDKITDALDPVVYGWNILEQEVQYK